LIGPILRLITTMKVSLSRLAPLMLVLGWTTVLQALDSDAGHRELTGKWSYCPLSQCRDGSVVFLVPDVGWAKSTHKYAANPVPQHSYSSYFQADVQTDSKADW
jgi:hypothetical protein